MTSGVAAELARRAEEAVRREIPAGTRCALVGYGAHENVGDAAIWVGARRLLKRAGARVVYQCEFRTYRPEHLDRALGRNGAIVFTGGGNFGDLWTIEQQLRERVLGDFPDRRIVQLPQSLWFDDPAAEARAAAAWRRCSAATLMVRDDRSARLAADRFGGAVLCPDMAFGLGPLTPSGAPDVDVVWVARADAESAGTGLPAFDERVRRFDWLESSGDLPRLPAGRQAMFDWNRRRSDAMWARGGIGRRERLVEWTYLPLARARLRWGIRLLSRGRVVVSDRLHTHILAMLAGIPHVALDTRQGKVGDFLRTWGIDDDGHRAASPDEALEQALRLAGDLRARS